MIATQATNVRRRKLRDVQPKEDPDLLVKLYEFLQGERGELKIFSKVLGEELYFVNPVKIPESNWPTEKAVYTTREIAFVLSLSPAELQRYHYLKSKLV
jgi:hypothetical protein